MTVATGPEHYQAAQKELLHAATAGDDAATLYHLGCAQVHATLAVAAATAVGNRPKDWPEWVKIASD